MLNLRALFALCAELGLFVQCRCVPKYKNLAFIWKISQKSSKHFYASVMRPFNCVFYTTKLLARKKPIGRKKIIKMI
jgi:hypothetical protein